MEIDQDNFGVNAFQKLVGNAKRIVVRSHKDSALQVDHSIRSFSLLSLVEAPAGHVGWIVGRAQNPACRSVAVAFDHLKVVDDFALVPDVVAGGDDVDIQLKQFFGERRRNAETGGRILAVGNDQVDGLIADNAGQPVFDDGAARTSENVADEENTHLSGAKLDGNTRRLQLFATRCGRSTRASQPSFGQFSRSQKVVVSRGIQLQIDDTLVVDKNVIQIPEVDIRQLFGQYALEFGIG